MKFNVDRIAELAGLGPAPSKVLREGKQDAEEDPKVLKSDKVDEDVSDEETMEVYHMEEHDKEAPSDADSLQEAKLRKLIRKEIGSVLRSMREAASKKNDTADWLYGDKKPTNSQKGRIARGFFGPGFK